MGTWAGWDRELLGALGVEATAERLRFVHAWQRAEGGNASFNPFNTTEGVNNAPRYNSAGVRSYRDPLEGIAATLLTLRLPFYRDLLAALRAPGINAAEIIRRGGHGLDVWGTRASHVRNALR